MTTGIGPRSTLAKEYVAAIEKLLPLIGTGSPDKLRELRNSLDETASIYESDAALCRRWIAKVDALIAKKGNA